MIKEISSPLSYMCPTNFTALRRKTLRLKVGVSPSKRFAWFDSLKPFKNDEECFLFHIKSSFCSQDI